jgi:hypothetical protein
VYIYDDVLFKGQILTVESILENVLNNSVPSSYTNKIYIVTQELLKNVTTFTINETQKTYTINSYSLVQPSYLPFTLYKKNSLGDYFIFIRELTFNFLDNFTFNLNRINKFYLSSKFASFNMNEKYAPQVITPSLELTTSITNSTSTNIIYEQAIFRKDLYRRLFEYIDFNIGDQTVEQLNKDVMEIQYQFLKDPQKRNQIDKIVKTYDNGNNGIRLIVPLEFWFNADTTKYLPLVCLTYTLISLKVILFSVNIFGKVSFRRFPLKKVKLSSEYTNEIISAKSSA